MSSSKSTTSSPWSSSVVLVSDRVFDSGEFRSLRDLPPLRRLRRGRELLVLSVLGSSAKSTSSSLAISGSSSSGSGGADEVGTDQPISSTISAGCSRSFSTGVCRSRSRPRPLPRDPRRERFGFSTSGNSADSISTSAAGSVRPMLRSWLSRRGLPDVRGERVSLFGREPRESAGFLSGELLSGASSRECGRRRDRLPKGSSSPSLYGDTSSSSISNSRYSPSSESSLRSSTAAVSESSGCLWARTSPAESYRLREKESAPIPKSQCPCWRLPRIGGCANQGMDCDFSTTEVFAFVLTTGFSVTTGSGFRMGATSWMPSSPNRDAQLSVSSGGPSAGSSDVCQFSSDRLVFRRRRFLIRGVGFHRIKIIVLNRLNFFWSVATKVVI